MARPDTAERNRQRATHRMSREPIFLQWCSMVARCTKPADKAYAKYGGRGIRVCDRWLAFENFYADMGARPDGMSLGRIDNNGPYSPENCRWETRTQQNNNRRNNRQVTAFGRTQTIAEWAHETAIPYATLASRISRGWPTEEAMTRPTRSMSC
jgi:hypothetical protein